MDEQEQNERAAGQSAPSAPRDQPDPAGKQTGQFHQPGSSDEQDDRQPSRIGSNDEDQVAGTNQDVDKTATPKRGSDDRGKQREDQRQR